MEDLIIFPAILVGTWIATALADLVGLAMGLGWGHYSRKRRQRKLEEQEQIEKFK